MEQQSDLAGVIRGARTGSGGSERGAYTPGVVHAVRIIMIIHGIIVLASGIYLVRAEDTDLPSAFGYVSVVEGALRVITGVLLRRGANALRIVALVLSAIGVLGGFMAGGIGIVAAIPNVIVSRCLMTDDAKEYFAAG